MAKKKLNKFSTYLTDEELQWLKEMADNKGLPASPFVRSIIRKLHFQQK